MDGCTEGRMNRREDENYIPLNIIRMSGYKYLAW